MMDENFLLHRSARSSCSTCMKRARQGLVALRVLVGERDPPVRHAAARRARRRRGSGWASSRRSAGYVKLNGHRHARADARAAVARHLRPGIDHRRPGASHARKHAGEIEHAIAHDTDFHQFMLYTPVPGHAAPCRNGRPQGRMLDGDRPRRHPRPVQVQLPARGHLARRLEAVARLGVPRDYDVNGPSLFRMMRTMFEGWRRYRADADPRVRARFAAEAAQLRGGYAAALWAMERYLRDSNVEVSRKVRTLRKRSSAIWAACPRCSTRRSGRCCSGRRSTMRRNTRTDARSSLRVSSTGHIGRDDWSLRDGRRWFAGSALPADLRVSVPPAQLSQPLTNLHLQRGDSFA